MQLRSVVLINCGGNLDLYTFFGEPEHITFYVFDSHRPLDLSNIHEKDGAQQVGMRCV